MINRIILLFMSVMFVLGITWLNTAEASKTKVWINNEILKDANVILNNGVSLVPMRKIFEALDSQVTWDQTKQEVTARKGQSVIKFQVGSKVAEKDGSIVTLSNKVELIGGVTYVPLRFVGEGLGLEVRWDKSSPEDIYISDKFSLTSTETDNGKVSLRGNKLNYVDQVQIFVTKTVNPSRYAFFKEINIKNGEFPETEIYLRGGKGVYEVQVYPFSKNTLLPITPRWNVNNTLNMDVAYLAPSDSVQSDSTEIINLAKDITKEYATDYEKTKAIHDWVTQNIAYDTETYFSVGAKAYTSLEALHGKKAQCNGYANLLAALNRAIGLPTKIIIGPVLREGIWLDHAWNEVFVDNRWVIQDSTWNAGYVNGQTFSFNPHHKYFDPDEKVFAEDHQRVMEMDY